MTLWLDAHLSPRIARWVSETFGCEATPVRDLNLRESEDDQIFFAARSANAIVITKDSDFVTTFLLHGRPPKLLLLATGNISNDALVRLLVANLATLERSFEWHHFIELNSTTITIHA